MTLDVLLPLPVLLIEDEDLIIDVLESILTENGYEVTKAQNGTEALHALEADAMKFRAIITDVRLGSGPDGWEIGRHARELIPHMPIVYISGDSAYEWASQGVPNSVILAKPFAPAQLVTAVSTLVTKAALHLPPATDGDGDDA